MSKQRFAITDKFTLGYQNKRDLTNIDPRALVVGSKNVLFNDGERIEIRKGFTLDGQAGSTTTGVKASFGTLMHTGQERHLRAYTNGASVVQLEYRFVDASNVVTWRTLSTGFASASMNFAVFFDNTEQIDRILFVDGSSNVFDWSGGLATFASATLNTITKQGTSTWAEEGFYAAGTRQVVIDGIVYTYTGGETTTTLTGVAPNPLLGGHAVGAPIHQAIRTTPNGSIAGLPAALKNNIISVLYNQVYIASFTVKQVFVSKQNSFTNFTFASPRIPGDGALFQLDGTPVAFVPDEESMYVSAGDDQWYKTFFQLSADQAREALFVRRLKTASQQGAQSQALVAKVLNDITFVSREPSLASLGRIENVDTPQTKDVSDPIKIDFDNTNFTGGQVFYFLNSIFISAPVENLVYIFDLRHGFWQPPQVLAVGFFDIIDGVLYGHSSSTNETYKLFTGTNDNGNAVEAVAAFPYLNFSDRAKLKVLTEYFAEGYITSNTELTLTLRYDFNGCGGTKTFSILGTDTSIVCDVTGDGSLGKQSLGKRRLAGGGDQITEALPPKFRVIKETAPQDFFEIQAEFSSNNVDQVWQILAHGSDTRHSPNDTSSIKQA